MNVLMLTPGYPPLEGGGERYVAALAQELASRGHRMVVVTAAGERAEAFWSGTGSRESVDDRPVVGITVIRLPLRGFAGRRLAMLALRKAMTALGMLGDLALAPLERCGQRFPGLQGIDQAVADVGAVSIVHSFNISWEQCILTGGRIAGRLGVPHVTSPFFHIGGGRTGSVWRNNGMPHQRRALAAADAVLANTPSERDGLIALGVEPARLHIVGAATPALDAAAFDVPPPTLPGELTTGEAPIVLFLGRVSHDKGALLAMRAVAQLHRQGVACRLALAGQPSPEAQRLASRLRRQGLPIDLLGLVGEPTKAWLLAHCRALVLPSRTDSFGLVLLEAWQHGKPVVVANVGGPADLVTHGVDGLQAPWGDVDALAAALRRVLCDRVLAERLGSAGQAKVATHYTWAAVADRVEYAYRCATASHSGESSGVHR